MPETLRSTPTSRPRALPATRWLIAGVAGAVVTAVLSMPQIALAHAKLKSSLPAANATVSDAPHELRLTFTEKPELAVSKVILLADGKDTIPLGKLAADAKSAETVVAPVSGHLGAGRYTVQYRVAGRDGHPIRGSFAFTVGKAE